MDPLAGFWLSIKWTDPTKDHFYRVKWLLEDVVALGSRTGYNYLRGSCLEDVLRVSMEAALWGLFPRNGLHASTMASIWQALQPSAEVLLDMWIHFKSLEVRQHKVQLRHGQAGSTVVAQVPLDEELYFLELREQLRDSLKEVLDWYFPARQDIDTLYYAGAGVQVARAVLRVRRGEDPFLGRRPPPLDSDEES